MALYTCTRFNYAHRKFETQGFEASTDEAARAKAQKIARDHRWPVFELHDEARLVFRQISVEAAL
jgi:hypothetical protein